MAATRASSRCRRSRPTCAPSRSPRRPTARCGCATASGRSPIAAPAARSSARSPSHPEEGMRSPWRRTVMCLLPRRAASWSSTPRGVRSPRCRSSRPPRSPSPPTATSSVRSLNGSSACIATGPASRGSKEREALLPASSTRSMRSPSRRRAPSRRRGPMRRRSSSPIARTTACRSSRAIGRRCRSSASRRAARSCVRKLPGECQTAACSWLTRSGAGSPGSTRRARSPAARTAGATTGSTRGR